MRHRNPLRRPSASARPSSSLLPTHHAGAESLACREGRGGPERCCIQSPRVDRRQQLRCRLTGRSKPPNPFKNLVSGCRDLHQPDPSHTPWAELYRASHEGLERRVPREAVLSFRPHGAQNGRAKAQPPPYLGRLNSRPMVAEETVSACTLRASETKPTSPSTSASAMRGTRPVERTPMGCRYPRAKTTALRILCTTETSGHPARPIRRS